MPKSKRDKRISLTTTKGKGLKAKQILVEEVRKSVEVYDRVFLFSIKNMRNSKLKEVRNAWKHSRIFFGKNKVMALAFGRTPEAEIMEGLHKISIHLHNEVGILFTSKSKQEVMDWFGNYLEHDFARAGNIATSTVELNEGPLEQFSHAIEPHLRKLGLPVALKKGIVTMLRHHVVCNEGDVLTPEQTLILKHLNIVLTEFRISLLCTWDKNSGQFEMLDCAEKPKAFNIVRVTADDQEYDFVEKEKTKKTKVKSMGMEVETIATTKTQEENPLKEEEPLKEEKTPKKEKTLKEKSQKKTDSETLPVSVSEPDIEEVTQPKVLRPRRSMRLRKK